MQYWPNETFSTLLTLAFDLREIFSESILCCTVNDAILSQFSLSKKWRFLNSGNSKISMCRVGNTFDCMDIGGVNLLVRRDRSTKFVSYSWNSLGCSDSFCGTYPQGGWSSSSASSAGKCDWTFFHRSFEHLWTLKSQEEKGDTQFSRSRISKRARHHVARYFIPSGIGRGTEDIGCWWCADCWVRMSWCCCWGWCEGWIWLRGWWCEEPVPGGCQVYGG
jgi:hypothetical protein